MPPHECMIEHNLGQKLYGTHLLPQMQITDVILFIRGQSYKANFGINYIKKGLSKLNFTLNYINFDVIYAKKVL